jgi:hypothetical protein
MAQHDRPLDAKLREQAMEQRCLRLRAPPSAPRPRAVSIAGAIDRDDAVARKTASAKAGLSTSSSTMPRP